MRFFFRSRQFKIILSVFLVITIVSLIFGISSSRLAPYTDIAGIITAPFKNFSTTVAGEIKDFTAAYKAGNELMLKNAELSSEINDLRQKNVDYDKIKAENDFYKKYLEIKEENTDFKFVPATLISRDSGDPFGGFTINKGSSSDIAVHDPVITDQGLIGYIGELGTTTAKVITILSSDITLGALDSRTSDSGILKGNIELAEKGMCRFSNLARSCSVAIGDYVITSGEGIFPDGLLIGSISYIGNDKYNSSIYADITPFVDFSSVRKVMVINSFKGQGGIVPSSKK